MDGRMGGGGGGGGGGWRALSVGFRFWVEEVRWGECVVW